jgi:hypothetical protein
MSPRTIVGQFQIIVGRDLKADTPKGHKIGIADVEFWLIEFKLVDYEQIKESAEWPKVLH